MGKRLEMGLFPEYMLLSRLHLSLLLEYPASIAQAILYQKPQSTDFFFFLPHFNLISLSIRTTNRIAGLLIWGYY